MIKFFEKGGMIRVSRRIFVSVFALLSLVLYLFLDFSGYTAAFLAAVFFHELSHIAFMHFFGIVIERVTVFPFGVDIRCDMSHLSYFGELCVVLSGSAANLVMFAACFFLARLCTSSLLLFFAFSNLALGIANLIPLSFFDGGRAFRIAVDCLFLPDTAYYIEKYQDAVFGVCFAVFCLFASRLSCFNVSVVVTSLYALVISLIAKKRVRHRV